MKSFLQTNGFLLGVVIAVAGAWLWPGIAADDGPAGGEWIRSLAVAVLFFFQGLSLAPEALYRGVRDVRLHLCSQLAIFLLSPLIMLVLLFAATPFLTDPALRTGFIYLAVLPTTVASATALTSLAGGNVSGALFNATLSNVAGVFLVPVVVFAFLVEGADESYFLAQGLAGVVKLILAPLILGQISRKWLAEWVLGKRTTVRRVTAGLILFLIYAAFCQSFAEAVWVRVDENELIATLAVSVLFLGLLSYGCWRLGRAFRLAPESRIAALLCGSQKTLVAGLPMAVSLFAATGPGSLELSLILIPLLCYHTLQLLLAGWLVPRLNTWRSREEIGTSG